MIIAIDLDGVITGNPACWQYFTYHLAKNENNCEVIILSWRDGSNEERKQETIDDLKRFGITYHRLIMAPKRLPNSRIAAYWKLSTIKKENVDMWFDDELKSWKRDYKIPIDKLLPNVDKIYI